MTETDFVEHHRLCTEETIRIQKEMEKDANNESGFSWVASNLKRYFSPGGSSSQGGRPLKRLKTTPTSLSSRRNTPRGRSTSNSPAVFRVSNSPFPFPKLEDRPLSMQR